MRKILLAGLLAALICAGGMAHAATAFFHELPDMPLMPGLTEQPAEEFVFDVPGGRVLEAAAISQAASVVDIKNFYNSTLPALGWRDDGNGAFVRDKEHLNLIVEDAGNVRLLHLRVTPLSQ